MSVQYDLVIIGAGQAAAQCALKAREKGFQGSIVVIGEEAYLPYQRPPLSKKYLSSEITQADLLIYPETLYKTKNIEFRLQQRVTAIHPDHKTVDTSQGDTIQYTHLVIATGSRPNVLPESVLPKLDNVFAFRGIEDCHQIQNDLSTDKTLVILGGGYIGLELAAVAQKRGLHVYVLEKAERILQRVASEQTSRYIHNIHQQHGVQILENSGVAQFHHQDGRLTAVTLESGQYIVLDLMVLGIGVTANYEIAEACGINIQNRAIWVNEACETNLADIYAIGDCTCFSLDDEFTRLESVQNANEQAEVVAARINQLEAKYKPVPWFWSDQYNLKLQISGLGRNYNQVYSRINVEKGTASFWYFDHEILKAVDAINDPRAFMLSKKFLGKVIQNPASLTDPQVDLKNILI